MKKLTVCIVLMFLVTGVAYAGDKRDAGLKGMVIGFSQPVLGDNWREANHGSILEAAEEYGVKLKTAIAEGIAHFMTFNSGYALFRM